MKFGCYLLFTTLLLFPSKVAAYKILALFPHTAKSHFVMGEALMKGLAARGHQVFVVSHFPQDQPVANYTDISLVGSMKNAVGNMPLENVGDGDAMMTINMLANIAVETCEKALSYPPIQKLINSEETFDLIVAELFNTDCMLGFVHKFKVPFIAIGTSVMMPWGNARFGNPDNPSYIPHHLLAHSDRMTFIERLLNTVYQESMQWAYHFLMDMPTERIARRYFGDSLPPLADIARNTSLLLLSTHFSMNQPRPLVPQIIEVGGIHIPSPKPLPEVVSYFILLHTVQLNGKALGTTRVFSLPCYSYFHATGEFPVSYRYKYIRKSSMSF
jgi:glucuronosyltransferase